MKSILLWLVAFLIVGVFISPFFLFWPLKNKNRKIYVAVSAISSLAIYLWYFNFGYDLITDFLAKKSANLYYFYYDADDNEMLPSVLLMISSPFIFAKIIYQKFTKKRFFISLLFSALVVVALVLILAYYILPGAGSVLLNNI